VPGYATGKSEKAKKMKEQTKSMTNRNTVTMLATGLLACFGFLPQTNAAPEVVPPADGCYPGFTTAEGCQALRSLAGGSANTALGWRSLFSVTDASFNTGVGAGALVLNTGDSNTAVGGAALLLNTTGTENTAVGAAALVFNTDDDNTAVGYQALNSNVAGFTNVAVGAFAGANNDSSGNGTAVFNTALGGFALRDNVNGARNTAVGAGALEPMLGGNDNTAVGELAGSNYTGTETNNVCIGSGTEGTAGESNSIRIGDASTSGGIDVINASALANAITIGAGTSTQGITILTLLGFGSVSVGNGLQTANGASSCFVGGVFNQTPVAGSHAVVVGPNNKLADGTLSSRRFKKDIAPIDKLSEGILALRPVTFHWKTDNTNEPEFGLVAEEVAEVNLDWITRNPQGEVSGVRYETIPVLLLNEFLKEHKKVEAQQANIAELRSTVGVLTAQLREQAAQIQKVSAQLEASKAAPQLVANKP
jgi:Chaperone of endosialidase